MHGECIEFCFQFDDRHAFLGKDAAYALESFVKADEVPFADDVVFMLLALSPERLLSDLKRLDEIVSTYALFGLEVHLDPGKSEAVIKLRGEESKVQVKSKFLRS